MGTVNTPVAYVTDQYAVSGVGNVVFDQGPTVLFVTDSIPGQSFDPPANIANFNPTTGAGSYYDSGGNKTNGVSARYQENPVRLTLRGGVNGLVTGDETQSDEWPTNDPMASRRYKVAVLNSTDITIPGVDGTSFPAFTSGGASSDAMLHIDMVLGDYGPITFFLEEMGYPFSRIDAVIRPGATVEQLTDALTSTQLPLAQYDYVICMAGRNNTSFSLASMVAFRTALLARGTWLMACTPFPDAIGSAGYTDSSLAKLKSMSSFWFDNQADYPQIKVCDTFGVVSDPTATREAARVGLLGSDNVHPSATGARLIGEKMAADFPPISSPRRALARAGSGSDNLLTSGRFTGAGGTAGSGVTALVPGASVATGWTIGRKSANGTCIAQLWEMPPVERRNGVAYAANKVLDIGDPNHPYWYVVKTGGSAAAAFPQTAYDGILSGSAAYDPPSLAAGASTFTTVTVSGAALGDSVAGVAFSLALQGVALSATVESADTVRVNFTNTSGGTVDLASGTVTVQVRRASGVTLMDTTVGITDGTLNVYRIPKFTDSLDAVIYQALGVGATADGGRESMSFFNSTSLPVGVNVGDYLRGGLEIAQLSGFCKDPQLSLILKNGGGTQLAYAGTLVPNNLQSQAPGKAKPIRVKTRKTRKLQVRSTTATAELEFKPFVPVGICWFAVAVGTIEKVSAPGLID